MQDSKMIKPIDFKKFRKQKSRKGAISDLFVLMIVAFVFLVFLAVWLYSQDYLNTIFTSIQSPPGSVNISAAAASVFTPYDNALLSHADTIALSLIFGLVIGFFVTSFFVKTHPLFFIVYIFVIVIAVIVAAQLSNAYNTLQSTAPINTYINNNLKGSSFIMANLPVIMTVVGFVGAVLLFANIIREKQQGGYE